MDQLSEVQKVPKLKTIMSSISMSNFEQFEDHKHSPVYSYRKGSSDSVPKNTLNYIFTKDCSQTSKSDQLQGAIDQVASESKSSAFAMGKLLQQKAQQVRELCLRLEHREVEYLELEKKMLGLMQENPKCMYTNQLYDLSGKLEPNKQIFMKQDQSEASTPANNTINNIQTNYSPQNCEKPDNDYRSTKRLNRQRYLQPQIQSPLMCIAPLELFPECQDQLQSIAFDYLPRVSSDNCLYEDIYDSDSEQSHELPRLNTMIDSEPECMPTPKFNNTQEDSALKTGQLTFRDNINPEKPIGIASTINLKVQNCALSLIEERLEDHSLEDFRRGLTMLFSPKASAFNSKQLTPRQRRVLAITPKVIEYKVMEHQELQLCKFKRLIKMQIQALNLIWRMGYKIQKREQNEVAGQVLRGLRNDLLGFVDDFNKKYKALKQSGIGTTVFQQQTISRMTQIIELAKGYPQ